MEQGNAISTPAQRAALAPDVSPAAEYARRQEARDADARRYHRRHIWIGNARLVVFTGILILGWRAEKSAFPALYWVAGAVLVFVGLGGWHRRTVGAKNALLRAANFYRRGLERIEDRWSDTGETGEQFSIAGHLYAEDLDILGKGSLFQLLCVARTQMGKERLAAWLLTPAAAEEIKERQLAVHELSTKLDFREDLAVAGESEQIKTDGQMLFSWIREESALDYRRWWAWTLIPAALSIPALVYGFRSHWTPFVLLVIFNSILAYSVRDRLARMLNSLDAALKNLDALASLFGRIEAEPFECERLSTLRRALSSGETKASECIARLARLSQLVDSRRNMLVAILDVPLLYSLQLCFALQRWKDRFGAGVPQWIDAIAQMEALASLATYKFERPEDPFPEFVDRETHCFEAMALGHPLLPASSSVLNDVVLGGGSQILLVSGSNMSGKSTLLRAVGTNAVLAMAGAPVQARFLRLSPVSLGAAMRLSDSLQKGVSHFYAEISRIRQVVELSSTSNVLFLLDEILQGTNSSDRRAGAEGVVRTLIANGAIGLVTTHDLALTSLAEVFPGQVRNVHFQEKLESGKLHFDYRLREGVVTTSNGIELMRSIGLDV